MNYFEAHKLLNEVKDGINHPAERITYALFLTGDLETPDGGCGMDRKIQPEEGGVGSPRCVWVVAGNNQRH